MPTKYAGETKDTAAFTTETDLTSEIKLEGNKPGVLLGINNTGSNALTDLFLYVKVSQGDSFRKVLDGADWQTATNLLRWFKNSAGNLNTLGAGANSTVLLDLGPAYSFKLAATAGSSATTTVTVSASGPNA